MHLKWHLGVPCALLIVEQGQTQSELTLALAGLPTIVPEFTSMTFFMFLLGSVVPDCGGIGYKIGAWFYNKELPILYSSQWNRRFTRRFAALEKVSWWPMLYILPHSLVGIIGIAIVSYSLLPSILASYFIAGIILHLAMDYPTHRICYLWWPFAITRAKSIDSDWWTQ